MLHRIFQRHGIMPQEFYALETRYKTFMYASELLAIEEEEKRRKEVAK